MKKTIAILIAALMLLSMIPVSAFAADEPACLGTEHTKENCEYEEYKKVPSVCGELGYTVYQCKACGDYFAADFYEDEGTHKFDKKIADAVAPNCEKDGSKEHYVCSVCGKDDPARDGSKIDKIGPHDWKTVSQTGNCLVGGELTEKCSKCGEEKVTKLDSTTGLGHNYAKYPVEGTIVPPTCSKEGSATFECTVCHTTKTLPIKKIDHEIVEDEAVAPTCTDTGLTAGEHCVNCDYKVEQKVVDALGHSWGADFDVVPATCETPYTAKHTCATCKVTETVTGKANGHTYGDEPDDIIPATCTTYGYELSFCTVCGFKKEDNVIDPLGHTEWDDKTSVITNFVAETCEANGTVSWNCGRCGVAQGPKTIDEIAGHALETKTVDPTCHHVGYTFSYCTNKDCCTYASISTTTKDGVKFDVTVDGKPVCFKELTVVGTELDPENHEYEEEITNPATCTDPGSKVKYCPWCEVQTYEVIKPLGHEYTVLVGVKTPATCTGDRVDTYKCKRCDATQDVTVPKTALGHAEQVVAKVNPTCTDKGYTEYTKCTRCDWTDGRGKEIAATGHSYTGVVTDPTCEAAGYTTYTCSACGDSYKVDGEKYVYDPVFEYDSFEDAQKVHPQLDVNTRAKLREGDCYLKSLVTYTCGHCQKKIHVISDHSTGDHIWEVLEAKKNPTCTDDGAEIKYHCTRTGCNETKGGEKINKLGHDWKASPCGAVGQLCERCGLDENYRDHNVEEIYTYTEGCLNIGFTFHACSNPLCFNETIQYLDNYKAELGHDHYDIDKLDPTCKDLGHTAGKGCNRCDYDDTVEIGKVNHHNEKGEELLDRCDNKVEGTRVCKWCATLVEMNHPSLFEVEIAPDCNSEGYGLEVCPVCDYEDVSYYIPMREEHLWSAWYQTKAPTYTEEGEEQRHCICCKAEGIDAHETRSVDVLTGLNITIVADNAIANGYELVNGGKVQFTVELETIDMMANSLLTTFVYDSTILSFDKAEIANVFGEGTFNDAHGDDKTGTVILSSYAPNTAEGKLQDVKVSGKTIYAVLTFNINKNAAGKDAVLTATEIELLNIAEKEPVAPVTKVAPVSSEAVVIEQLGNANGDKGINSVDTMTIRKMMSGELVIDKTTVQYNAKADVDMDGDVDLEDFARLNKYLIGAITYDQLVLNN